MTILRISLGSILEPGQQCVVFVLKQSWRMGTVDFGWYDSSRIVRARGCSPGPVIPSVPTVSRDSPPLRVGIQGLPSHVAATLIDCIIK